MGVSVSVSAAIVFVGLFIALGMVVPSVANGYEAVSEARSAAADATLDQQNTAIAVANATYGGGTLTVEVDNEGTTALVVNDTDVLVDNDYQTDFVTREVDGDATTDVWLPGETLTVEVSAASQPTRVVVVTEGGVSAGVTL